MTKWNRFIEHKYSRNAIFGSTFVIQFSRTFYQLIINATYTSTFFRTQKRGNLRDSYFKFNFLLKQFLGR